MFDQILVPTDGSGPATATLEYASEIAAAEDATVHLLYVTDSDDEPAATADPLADGRSWIEDTGVAVITETVRGEPAATILEYASDHAIDVIMMGTRGRSGVGRLLWGSVTESVVRDADVPVLSVRGTADVTRQYPFETIVVPIDGSPHATVALEAALSLANDLDATVHLLSVVDVTPTEVDAERAIGTERLEHGARRVLDDGQAIAADTDADVEVISSIRHGSTARAICAYVDEQDGDLLVMGTHGRSGIDRLLLGSVTERVLRTATVPVLTRRSIEASE